MKPSVIQLEEQHFRIRKKSTRGVVNVLHNTQKYSLFPISACRHNSKHMDGNTDVQMSQDDENGCTVHGGKQGQNVDQVWSMEAPLRF